VSVGLPREVPWQGRTVRTAVWKRPVSRAADVRRLNIDGDGQGDRAGHGGSHRAVMVYQAESYAHWQQHFGLDDFEYGQFGENFTVEGLADDTVCIGDQFEIGTALFEVSQPRVTCYRVGLRLGSRSCRRCWSRTGAPASTCGCCAKASCKPVTRSCGPVPGRADVRR